MNEGSVHVGEEKEGFFLKGKGIYNRNHSSNKSRYTYILAHAQWQPE